MTTTTRYIHTPSDQHGQPCEYCQTVDRVCVTNIYIHDADNEPDVLHTCDTMDCIEEAVSANVGDYDATVEVSTTPVAVDVPATLVVAA